jgi:hypothetical protein
LGFEASLADGAAPYAGRFQNGHHALGQAQAVTGPQGCITQDDAQCRLAFTREALVSGRAALSKSKEQDSRLQDITKLGGLHRRVVVLFSEAAWCAELTNGYAK